jgi:hypothetical protein
MKKRGQDRPPRIQTSIAAVLVDGNGGELPVEVIDLSSGGCRMRAKWALTNGAKVCLKVRHDEFPAEIVWVDGHEAGARFLEPVTTL